MKCKEIIRYLEQIAPVSYAEDWDNVGLLVGHQEQEVKKIVIALDATRDVINQAIVLQADMIITHHPMIFRPVNRITDGDIVGRRILMLAEHHIAYYAMHTNFDTIGGMAKLAAQRIGLIDSVTLDVTSQSDGEGIGQIGKLPEALTVSALCDKIKSAFQLPFVMLYGDQKSVAERVAISPGSGKSEIRTAINKGAQVLITGDIGHHEGLDALEDGLQIIDATHYGLEQIFIAYMEEKLKEMYGDRISVHTIASGIPCKVM